MKFNRNYSLKLFFVLLFLSLHSSFAWGMEQEDKSVYTHSHKTPDAACKIKALYIDENVLFTIGDRETNKVWERKATRPEDDRYLRLLKEASINYLPNSGKYPNHLMVGVEALFIHSDTQKDPWQYWHLSGEKGAIRDFCSAPPNSLYHPQVSCSLSIKLAEEEKPQEVFIGSGTMCKKEGTSVKPYYCNNSFPILSWIKHDFISLKDNAGAFPHSEIEALNALIKIDYRALFNPILDGNSSLQALIFKFYSNNDICDECQSAIQDFIPKFQAWLTKEFGTNERIIPVTAIAMANHCYGWNGYYKKEGNACKPFQADTILKNTPKGIHTYLKEDIVWQNLEQSKYNTCRFALLKRGEYNPFSGTIPTHKQEQDSALYIYIKQPNIDDLEEHIKPESLERFGILAKGIPEVTSLLEEKQNNVHDKHELK